MFLHHWIALHCIAVEHCIAFADFELHGVTSQQGTSFCQHCLRAQEAAYNHYDDGGDNERW